MTVGQMTVGQVTFRQMIVWQIMVGEKLCHLVESNATNAHQVFSEVEVHKSIFAVVSRILGDCVSVKWLTNLVRFDKVGLIIISVKCFIKLIRFE